MTTEKGVCISYGKQNIPPCRWGNTDGRNIGKYGESVAAYESVLAGEAWPDNFWAATNLNRRIKEILTYLLRDKLKINEYETAKGVLSAGFIEEYGLSKLVEKAGRPSEMMEGEFTYLLWYVFRKNSLPRKN